MALNNKLLHTSKLLSNKAEIQEVTPINKTKYISMRNPETKTAIFKKFKGKHIRLYILILK